MAAPRRVTQAERDEILRLHAAGKSRNDIMRATGRSAHIVTKTVKDAGLSFDRTGQVAAATAARQADNKARRAQLVSRLYDRAEEFLEQVDKPHVVFNFGGKDNTYEERTLDRPPTPDIRNLIQSASIALQRAADLEAIDADTGAHAVIGLLQQTAAALGIVDAPDEP
jgi:hypothetical protein